MQFIHYKRIYFIRTKKKSHPIGQLFLAVATVQIVSRSRPVVLLQKFLFLKAFCYCYCSCNCTDRFTNQFMQMHKLTYGCPFALLQKLLFLKRFCYCYCSCNCTAYHRIVTHSHKAHHFYVSWNR